MSHPIQGAVHNRLLRLLPADSFLRLQPHLEPVPLTKGLVILKADTPFAWAYFPEYGVASIISSDEGRRLEIGLFGRDGMGSTALVLGTDRTPHETVIQVEGHGHRIAADVLREALAQDPALQALLLRYIHVFSLQLAQTAVSNGSGTIEERLARWLLLTHDRLDGNDLPVTHEFLAIMLGVRRPGVTLATHMLEGAQVIRAKRGLITVTDRAKLEQLAGRSYGSPELEYERLIGPMRDAVG